MYAKIFDVDVAAETGVEKQIPTGMVIVVIDVHSIVVPLPIAAAIEVVRSNYPTRIVVELNAASPEIHAPGNEVASHMLVTAVRIGPAWLNAIVIGVPVGVGIAAILPIPVIPVVVAVATIIPMPVITAVFAFIVAVAAVTVVVAVLRRCSEGNCPCQGHEQNPC